MGVLTSSYDASFDGVSFQEQGDWRPGRDVLTEGDTIHIDDSDEAVAFDMGEAPAVFEVGAGLDSTQYTAILAKRGTSGTLAWSRGSTSVKLLSILDKPGLAEPFSAYTIGLRFLALEGPTVAGMTVAPSTAMLAEDGAYMLTEAGEYIIQE